MKVDYYKEYTQENKVLLLNFTETWLNKNVKDDAEIEGYTIFRGDRQENITQGGTAIYISDKVKDGNLIKSFSSFKCEMVAVNISTLNITNIVIYRPPHTRMNDFSPILDELENLLKNMGKPNPVVILSGDFNFPFVEWLESGQGYRCRPTFKPDINATLDEKNQFERLMKICKEHNMSQVNQIPTRGKNVLDLLFTNDGNIFIDIEVNKSGCSDHSVLEASTNIDFEEKINKEDEVNSEECKLRDLNFHHDKINWNALNRKITGIPWKYKFNNKGVLECWDIFINYITALCIELIPIKNKYGNKRKIPKERRRKLNRIKKIKKNRRRETRDKKKEELDEIIQKEEKELLELRAKEKADYERKITEKMTGTDNKILYSYVKKQKCRKNEIGPFKVGNDYITDNKTICEMLVEQFNSVMNASGDHEFDDEKFDNTEENYLTNREVI